MKPYVTSLVEETKLMNTNDIYFVQSSNIQYSYLVYTFDIPGYVFFNVKVYVNINYAENYEIMNIMLKDLVESMPIGCFYLKCGKLS